MIYTFDARGFLLYPAMKSYFELSDRDVYQTIQNGFDALQKQLAAQGIDYHALKSALIPNQEKDRFETCLILDSSQIDASDYGQHIFEKLIPLLDKESTYSVFCGDYVDDLSRYSPDSQALLRSAMDEVLARCHVSRYRHSSQYFLVYFSRLTAGQRLRIVEGLYPHPWFTGFADLTHRSLFKSYLSAILPPLCVKSRDRIILPHPADCPDEGSVNLRGSPFEANGFLLSRINEDSYGTFLSYKIESEAPDRDDVGFSLNALFPKLDSFEKIELDLSNDKWDRYLTDRETGKGRILESLGYDSDDKERFMKEIFKQICANYIYNLRKNPYGDLMFDVCLDLPTVHGHLRKTTVALKYHPDTGTADVVTVT